jgi:hypothetical protein
MATESRSELDFEKRDEFGNNEANALPARDVRVDPGARSRNRQRGRALLRQLRRKATVEGVEINQDRIDEPPAVRALPITKVDGPCCRLRTPASMWCSASTSSSTFPTATTTCAK